MLAPWTIPAQVNVSGMSSVILWSTVLLALIILLFFLYTQLKRWMTEADEPIAGGFTLADLRKLHRQGNISTEEFEMAKSKLLGTAKAMTDQMPAVLPQRRPPPDRPVQ